MDGIFQDRGKADMPLSGSRFSPAYGNSRLVIRLIGDWLDAAVDPHVCRPGSFHQGDEDLPLFWFGQLLALELIAFFAVWRCEFSVSLRRPRRSLRV
jgi:hypothetical protein